MKHLIILTLLVPLRYSQWLLPIRFDASPSGYLGVSYMDGKVWLDVKDLTGTVQFKPSLPSIYGIQLQ